MLQRRLPYDMVNQHPTERGKPVPSGESQPNQAGSESLLPDETPQTHRVNSLLPRR